MTEITDEQRVLLKEAIEAFNDILVTQSINLSGQAFNNALKLGCGLMLIPVIIALVVTQILRGLDFSAVFVYLCAGTAVSIVFSTIIANRAKYLAVQEKYKADVNPDIVRFLAENQLTRAQFDLVADDILGLNAPLREYLVVSSEAKNKKEEAHDNE